jgi:hypothetical protein
MLVAGTVSGEATMKALVLAGLIALGSASVARAEDEDARADVRCVLAMYALMSNPNQAANAFSAALFFTGRLEGRDPKIDVGAAVKTEMKRMSQSDYPHEMQRCGDEAKTRSQLLQTVGVSLQPARRGVGN